MKIKIKNKSKTISFVFANDEIWGILPDKILHFFSLNSQTHIELDPKRWRELQHEIEKFVWDKLLNFLSYRERSVGECKNYLEQLPLETNLMEKLVQKAISFNYVNNSRFAELFVESLIGKNKNVLEIKNKLFEKQITEKIINETITKIYSKEKQDEILTTNVKKALLRYSKFSDEEKIEKTLNYLTRRGFSYWEVKEKLEEKY
ncbi:MAG: RecX family transcriptional regulator [Armatimonadetes bacterium]|nr:RecX family transcriptional regulator [Armatimonadota bacterium]